MTAPTLLLGLLVLGQAVPKSAARPNSDVRFSHLQHYEELGLDCVQCHRSEARGRDVVLPQEAYCLGCHDGRVAPSECAACHLRPDAPSGYRPEPSELIFSHPKHVDLSGVTCLTCHGNVPASEASPIEAPAMAACFTCHDGIRQTTECAACHSDPRKVTEEVHPPGWREDHRLQSSLDQPACEPCHRTDDRCGLCHAGDNYRGTIHPFNWSLLHATDARARSQDCTACHDTRAFCVDCHRSRFVLPLDHQSPDWLSRHAKEARFDLETCDACHGDAEPSCYRSGCHGF